MVLKILTYLHRSPFQWTLPYLSQVVYFLKGYGFVPSSYFKDFRGYSYKVKGVTYLSMGPGWACSYEYLEGLIKESYNYFYMPKAGDCVVDIGAGLGEETVIYAMLTGRTGSVHAMEANPATFAGLKYMLDKNNFVHAKAYNVAIYFEDGEVTIEDDTENYLTNTVNAGGSIVVKARTLDSWVKENGISRIDFLKCNIEGAEQFLIRGMESSFRIIKNMCISCHDFRHVYHQHGDFYMTKNKVKAFLESHGFDITIRNTGNRLVDDYIYARNTNL